MADSDQAEVKAAAPLPPKPTRPLPQPRALSLSVTASSNDESTSNPAQPIDDSFEGIVSRIKGLRDPQDPNKLTPLRAHYLKKHLVGLQLNQEIHALSDKDALSTFGPPFSPSPNATRADLPLLRFLFHHFVLTFPFLRSAPSNFFSAKVQVFFNRFLSRNISSTDDRTETTKRTKVASKISKYASLLISSAVSVSGITGDEQVVKISESDRERISILENKLKRAINGQAIHEEFDVNVIGVRTVTSKGRLRNRSHEEFVIRTKRTGVEDVFVSRRYGDFIRLAETLRIEFPDEEIRPPPSKDRSGIEIGQERRRDARIEGGGDEEGMEFLQNESGRLSVDDQVINTPPSAPPTQTRTRVRTLSNAANKLRGGHSTPSSPSSSNANLPPPVPPLPGSSSTSTPLPTGPLAREKNRLTLRAYIRSLLSLPQVSESAALADFLLGEPVTLTNAEMEDARVREGLDELRASEASRFEDEASKRVKELKVHLDAFKEELIQPDGLTRIFSLIRSTPNLHDLPQRYLSLLSWARISLASTLFSLFMGSDTSSELFGQLKRIHGLMPYFMLRQILRISNPVSMIRGVLDLFLAQPFGGRSLAQRMVSGGLMDDVKSLGEICNAVARKVEDDDMCERVRCFVYASREVQETFRNQAKDEGLDLITVILRAPVQEFETIETPTSNASDPNKVESPPNPFLENLRPLNRSQIQKAVKASRAFERYKLYRKEPGEDDLKDGKNNEEDEFDVEGWGPKEEDEDAWLYEDLHVLLRMCTRLRDKEQLIELVFEGVTSELLKDMVTIFYSPLAQVYKAANIADSLYDLQRFIDDLIKTIEGCEEVAYSDPQAIVQVFIDLVARHEAKFYNFVHQVHSKGSGLFDGLMQWIELFINFVRGSTATNLDPDSSSSSTNQHPAFSSPDGTSAQQGKKSKRRGIGAVDLEVCLPAGGTQRQEALAEIDALVVHAYRLKYQREIKLRKRVVRREVEGAGNKAESSTRQVGGKNTESWNEDDDAQFVRAAVENLGVGDVFSGEVEEADEDSSAEEEEEEDEDAEFFDPNQEPGTTSNSSKLSTGRSIGHRRLASGEDEDASWRPPPKEDKDLPPIPTPNRSDSTFINAGTSTGDERQDKIDRERKRKGKAPAPRLPPLKHIPEMVPLFVEMLRPLLRPARTASGSSTTALADAAIASPPLPPPQAPARGGWW